MDLVRDAIAYDEGVEGAADGQGGSMKVDRNPLGRVPRGGIVTINVAATSANFARIPGSGSDWTPSGGKPLRSSYSSV